MCKLLGALGQHRGVLERFLSALTSLKGRPSTEMFGFCKRSIGVNSHWDSRVRVSTGVGTGCEQVGGSPKDEMGSAERGKEECFASPQETRDGWT